MKKSVLMASVVAVGLALFATDGMAATKTAEPKNSVSCPGGKYLKHKACVDCDPGHYCPDGKSKKICPVGSYCTANSPQPTACTGNQYTKQAGQAAPRVCTGANQIVNANHTGCITCSSKQEPNEDHTACVNRCEPKQYATGVGKKRTCSACTAGHYCPDGKSKKICPVGSYCPENSAQPTACTGNQYTTQAGQAAPKVCTGANQAVNANHTRCTTCASKQEPNEDHTACVNRCQAGTYAKSLRGERTCPACEDGYYCPDGRNHKRCANGSIPNANKTGCQVCANGTYEKDFKACEKCPEGSYCSNGKKTACNNKQYCPANSAQPKACPANATCNGKIFTCKKGYRKSGEACVK